MTSSSTPSTFCTWFDMKYVNTITDRLHTKILSNASSFKDLIVPLMMTDKFEDVINYQKLPKNIRYYLSEEDSEIFVSSKHFHSYRYEKDYMVEVKVHLYKELQKSNYEFKGKFKKEANKLLNDYPELFI